MERGYPETVQGVAESSEPNLAPRRTAPEDDLCRPQTYPEIPASRVQTQEGGGCRAGYCRRVWPAFRQQWRKDGVTAFGDRRGCVTERRRPDPGAEWELGQIRHRPTLRPPAPAQLAASSHHTLGSKT